MPTFREIAPAWAGASDKLAELIAREAAILAELAAIGKRLPVGGVVGPEPSPRARTPNAAALALLGRSVPAPQSQVEQPGAVETDRARAHRLNGEVTAVREAIRMLHDDLRREHAAGSRDYCVTRLLEYRAVAAKVCAAMVALGEAFREHQTFTRAIVAEGASPAYLRLLPAGVIAGAFGDPADRSSGFRHFLAAGAEGGHFDLASLPDAWRTGTATSRGVSASAPAAPAPGNLRERGPMVHHAPAVPRHPARVLAERVRAALS